MSVFKALLIDLDNTLILFNEDVFLQTYAQLAAPYFTDILDEATFFQKLLASTMYMLQNDGTKINVAAFTDHFITDVPQLSYKDCHRRFDQFYRESFNQLRRIIQPLPSSRQLLQRALNAGLQVVIATNPIFPKVASNQRLAWANIADLDIALVTHAENMRYCKPHPEYFQSVLKFLGRRPEECLMAGNDPVNDMAASAVGIKTFLIDIDQEKGRLGLISQQVGHQARKTVSDLQVHIDGRGTLTDLELFLFTQE